MKEIKKLFTIGFFGGIIYQRRARKMKKILTLIIIPLILMLGGCNTLQIFKPIETQINDNLLKNSGFWNNTDEWYLGNPCTLDTNKKYNNCNSIKSEFKLDSENNKYVSKIFVSQGAFSNKGFNTKNFTFSCFSECEKNLSTVNAKITYMIWYQDETTEVFNNIIPAKSQINSVTNKYTLNINAGASKKIKAIIIESIDINQEGATTNDCGYLWLYQPKLEYGSTVTPWCPSITDNQPFDYDSLKASYQSQKIGDIPNIISYDYTKSLTSVGSFNLSLNANEVFASEIKENTLLLYDGDWLIAQHVKRENNTLYVEGYDGKGLLKQRITLYDIAQDTGTMGYDVVQGSSELCLKHYVVNNIVNPVDSDRVIPTFTIAENKDRGIANDTYISRFEPLDEIAEKICKNANIGYDVKPDFLNNKMIFDVIDITDKTINQRDRNQVIFALEAYEGKLVTKLSKLTRETGVTNYKNAFYATKSGGSLDADATTILTKRAEDTVYAKGIYRREMQLNISCESVSDIITFAQQQMPQYLKTESFTLEIANPYEYGTLFFIGDKVTILYKVIGIDEDGKPITTIMQIDTVINGAKVTKSNGSYSVALSFGEAKPKPFKAVYTKINEKGV